MDNNVLEGWRAQIDEFDNELLQTLSKRMAVVRNIGKFKKTHGMTALNEKRWQKVLKSKLSKASSLNLSKKFKKKLYDHIHKYSLKIEQL